MHSTEGDEDPGQNDINVPFAKVVADSKWQSSNSEASHLRGK